MSTDETATVTIFATSRKGKHPDSLILMVDGVPLVTMPVIVTKTGHSGVQLQVDATETWTRKFSELPGEFAKGEFRWWLFQNLGAIATALLKSVERLELAGVSYKDPENN